MKFRKQTVSQLTPTTTGKCFDTQSKYFYSMFTGLLARGAKMGEGCSFSMFKIMTSFAD